MTDWKLYAFGAAVFAGLTAIFSREGVQGVSSNMATLLRTVIILMLLAAVIQVRNEWAHPGRIPARSVIFLVLSALATGFSWLCYFRALQTGPASLVNAIDKLSLVLVVILAYLFLQERPTSLQWVGTAMIACGAVLVALK